MQVFLILVGLFGLIVGFVNGRAFAIDQGWSGFIAFVVGVIVAGVIARIAIVVAGVVAGIFIASSDVIDDRRYSSHAKSKIAPPLAHGPLNTSYDDAIAFFRNGSKSKRPEEDTPQTAIKPERPKVDMWERIDGIEPLPPVTDR